MRTSQRPPWARASSQRRERGDQRAGVQQAGRRGREAADVARRPTSRGVAASMHRAQARRRRAAVALEQRRARRRALELLEPPVQRQAELRLARRAAARRGRRAPGVAERGRRRGALHLLDHQAAGGDVLAHQRLGHEAAAEAAQQRLDLGLHVAHREHVLAGQQVDRDRRQALRRVGDRDGAVARSARRRSSGSLARGERMVRRDREDEGHRRRAAFICTPLGSSRSVPTPIARSAWPVTSASQVPASTSVRRRSRVPAAPSAARQRAAPSARAASREQRVERLAQLEQRRARDDVVDGDA